jgi:hypothetical protein
MNVKMSKILKGLTTFFELSIIQTISPLESEGHVMITRREKR